MYVVKKTSENIKPYRIIINTNQSDWHFFDTTYIKVNEEVIKFGVANNNLSNNRNVLSRGNVGEYVVCYMDEDIFRKIITAETISISLRGSKGKLDYVVPKQDVWQKFFEY